MKIEEALQVVADTFLAVHGRSDHVAINTIRSHLEAKVVVDDAMVERACSKYMSFSNRHSGFKDAMRAAIQAAVGGDDA